jgi:hypothetical protein
MIRERFILDIKDSRNFAHVVKELPVFNARMNGVGTVAE